MIYGIGVDLVKIARIEVAVNRWHNRFLQRVFTPAEIDYAYSKKFPLIHLAGRFAGKEALLKALGTGLSQGISWKDISILPDARGKPVLTLSGKAEEIACAGGVSQIYATISHDSEYAIAQVVLGQSG